MALVVEISGRLHQMWRVPVRFGKIREFDRAEWVWIGLHSLDNLYISTSNLELWYSRDWRRSFISIDSLHNIKSLHKTHNLFCTVYLHCSASTVLTLSIVSTVLTDTKSLQSLRFLVTVCRNSRLFWQSPQSWQRLKSWQSLHSSQTPKSPQLRKSPQYWKSLHSRCYGPNSLPQHALRIHTSPRIVAGRPSEAKTAKRDRAAGQTPRNRRRRRHRRPPSRILFSSRESVSFRGLLKDLPSAGRQGRNWVGGGSADNTRRRPSCFSLLCAPISRRIEHNDGPGVDKCGRSHMWGTCMCADARGCTCARVVKRGSGRVFWTIWEEMLRAIWTEPATTTMATTTFGAGSCEKSVC